MRKIIILVINQAFIICASYIYYLDIILLTKTLIIALLIRMYKIIKQAGIY